MTASRARPPAPLPGRARALLAAYRDAHEIPADAEERIWSVVGADDAPQPAFDPRDEPARSSHVDRRGLAYAGATLAAAAVLLLAWRMGGTLAERREAERTPGAAVMQGGGSSSQGRAVTPSPRAIAAESQERPPAVEPSEGSTTTVVEPSEPSSPSTGEPRDRPRSSSSMPRQPSSSTREPSHAPSSEPGPSSEPAASTFGVERELVARAWRSLALGDHAQALQAAAEHARRFPAGLLVPERTAIETIARCRRDPARGPHLASAFHRAHPRSPLAERVDEACEKKSTTP